MILLIVYISIALGVSFLCSIAEAVLLCLTPSYISVLESKGKVRAAKHLKKLKEDVSAPLAAILTLNTVAHTAGAAGAGAQAAFVFGDHLLGVFSAILTLLILVFSELIPKSIGALYWRQLAPTTGFVLTQLVYLLKPFVKLSAFFTRIFDNEEQRSGAAERNELMAMASVVSEKGHLTPRQESILRNLLQLNLTRVKEILTPRTVVFSDSRETTVSEFLDSNETKRFSRIPISGEDTEDIVGYVLRSDVLVAHYRGDQNAPLSKFLRPMVSVSESKTVLEIFEILMKEREKMIAVIDEHGGLEGIVTLEDVIEEVLGDEIIDEGDETPDMRRLAKLKKLRRNRDQS